MWSILSILVSLGRPRRQRPLAAAAESGATAASFTRVVEDDDDDDVAAAARHRTRRSCCCGLVGAGWLSRWVGAVLRRGEGPRHVAFILDGNRRFAAKAGLGRASAGHALGFEKLHEALEWSFDAGIRVVSVFAFSIDNFKRPRDEVDALMALALDKLAYLLERSELMRRHALVVNVWGDLALLPPALRGLVQRVQEQTRGNGGPVLNVCFPYTSSWEVVDATRRLARACRAGELSTAGIDRDALEGALLTRRDHPDLLVRTSGEARLSDFLSYQTGHAVFLVYRCLWPEFSLLHFVAAVLYFRYAQLAQWWRRRAS